MTMTMTMTRRAIMATCIGNRRGDWVASTVGRLLLIQIAKPRAARDSRPTVDSTYGPRRSRASGKGYNVRLPFLALEILQ